MERTSRLELTQKMGLALLALVLFEIVVAITSGSVSAQMHEEWAVRYNRSGYSRDYATSIAVDAAGNVYVVGRSGGTLQCYGYATVKYDSSGRELWATGYNPNPCFNGAAAVAVDAAGNVYVTGSSDGPGMSSDYATIKYDANGNELWVARYDGPANSEDNAAAVAVDAASNVYVTGSSWTAKYDGRGNELWRAISNAVTMVVDAAGNVYVTGSSDGTSPADYTTIKYDPNGNELWLMSYNGPANSDDNPAAIALDGTGNVYVTGTSIGSDTREDYATIKIAPDDIETDGKDNGNGGGCFISATFN